MPKKIYDKEEILDTCLEVFAEHGYNKTSTAMLAKASGISRSLIFHHFKSKKDLYLSLLDRCFERGNMVMGFESVSEDENFFEVKDRISAIKFKYYKENPDLYKVIIEAFYNTPDELKLEIDTKYGRLIEERDKVQERLFENVPLRENVVRKEAYKLIKLALDYFENKYVYELVDNRELNECILENIIKERNSFINMIRFGIQK
ncbi:TetR/AcrR family transcriptional regulator [Sedimentibacter sp. MB31-C6]|uniref:TetR/AcrR family transcriptional regulator n=1 Tax=Sedimentibacter sp. MB31-C6 TaxID=3109366 RepID=UPI002DDD56B1|nr:TetR/AcrR family transcriptional regulator [Sedimentibacter sp. MB36-C1]WSI04646.1 TetR/AcrR family transcriptional regulator [Sedimentibacter sp. MB36-C1]